MKIVKALLMNCYHGHQVAVVEGLDDVAIELEMKDFNKEPCMESFLRVIQRMYTLCRDDWLKTDLPPHWLSQLMSQMKQQQEDDGSGEYSSPSQMQQPRRREWWWQ